MDLWLRHRRDQTSVTDPTGAQTQATYDYLGEQVTSTELVRQNTSAAYTTQYKYDDAGNQTSEISPASVTTKATYDALGEPVSTTDGANNTTNYTYNLDGALTKVTAPDGTASTATYDPAGRQTATADLSGTGAVLRTASAVYDNDGNIKSLTDFRGYTATVSYDATGMVTAQTQPTSATHSITVGYGYDLAGDPTSFTDGNGHTSYASYNALGLPQTITEPTTAAHSSAADSTTTDTYDGDGDLVQQQLPGGVQISSSYDSMGDLTGQSGTGATAATAAKAFTYDQAGRLLTATTSAVGTSGSAGYQPATSELFGYDDRGLLLSASGAAGVSSFTYNASDQLASATDAAGTSSFTYDTAGRLLTDADAASGSTGTYHYNNLDQLAQISYGAGNDTQNFGYDGLHRLSSDSVSTAGGSQVAAIGYGYDNNDNVTSITTSGLATAGGGTGSVTNTYGYDEANRLTSWTATPASGTATTKTYGYDDDGNLTSNNGATYSYDARDELTSDGSNTYSYSADGDLTGETGPGGSATFGSDAYGQQITDAGSSFSYDALGRLVQASSQANGGSAISLTYDGMTSQIASDSAATYSRDPSGALVGVHTTGGTSTLALNDQHDDLSGTFTAAGATMASSSTWDPWGNPIAHTGPTVELGYQGQWTDPATGQVDMGARFYKPSTGGFINADTTPAGNPYAYADDNPVSVTDPTGHSPSGGGSGNGTVTLAQVNAAAGRLADAKEAAARARTAAAQAKEAAAHAEATASSAVRYASELNNEASQIRSQAEMATQAAQQAEAQEQQALATYQQAQGAANAAYSEIGSAPAKPSPGVYSAVSNAIVSGGSSGASSFGVTGVACGDGPCIAVGGFSGGQAQASTGASAAVSQAQAEISDYNIAYAAYETRVSNYEKAKALAIADHQAYLAAKAHADALNKVAARLWHQYDNAHNQAVSADNRAEADVRTAAEEAATAKSLAADAAEAEKTVAEDEAEYQKLKREYDQEQREEKQTQANHKKKPGSKSSGSGGSGGTAGPPTNPGGGTCSTTPDIPSCRKAKAALAKVAQAAADVAASALTALIGPVLQSIATCVTHPTVAGCLAAAGNVVLIGSGFADIGADAAADGGLAEAATCGGESFTAGTKVLLASGAAVPISQLKAGDKVLATNTKTGKTQAETVTTVLVHHDSNLYDLQVRASGRTAVIDTTRNHLFWAPGTGGHPGRWIKASALRYGTHLRTPSGGPATVLGGWAPEVTTGWMWDLTVPGNNDHDFYVDTDAAAVLVHNCGVSAEPGPAPDGVTLEEYGEANRGANQAATPRFVTEYTSPSGLRYFGRTTSGAGVDVDPDSALSGALRVAVHRGCSEVCALNEAEIAEGPGAIYGGSFRTLQIRSLASDEPSGIAASPCKESCQKLIERLGGSW